MGYFICEKHGGIISFFQMEDIICKKIHSAEEIFDTDLEVISIKYILKDLDDLTLKYIVSKDTMNILNYKDEYFIEEDEIEDRDINLKPLNLWALCSKCLDEYPYKENMKDTLEKYRS